MIEVQLEKWRCIQCGELITEPDTPKDHNERKGHERAVAINLLADESMLFRLGVPGAFKIPVAPPRDWYDGKPKPCPGSGRPVFVSYHGECDSYGEELYRASCKECGRAFPLGTLPEHTLVPMDVDNVTFTQGSVLEGIEGIEITLSADELADMRANVKRMIAAALRKRSTP